VSPMVSLGGPGLACSAMRVRRLLAGELGEVERARAEEHLAACARCQSVRLEIEEEGRALPRALPFDSFAAGVAERMALAEPRRWRRALAPALAAGLALAAAVPLVSRVLEGGGGGPGEPFRSKGAASLEVFVQQAGGARALAPFEPVARGARLRPAIHPGAWRQAALALVDADGAAVLYAGPARPGPLPEAFEWTGGGAEGTLVLLLADEPLDAGALRARLERGGPPAPPGVRVVVLRVPLRRAGAP
jgi:Putative zinc-finger